MLEDVEQAGGVGAAVLLGTELGGGIGEVHAPVGRAHDVVGVADGHAVRLGGEHVDATVTRHRLQAPESIGHRQAIPRLVPVETERAPAHLDPPLELAPRLPSRDPALVRGGVQHTLGIDRQILGAGQAVHRHALEGREPLVGGMHAGVARILGRLPGHRIDGHRPQHEVGNDQ